jgi:CubicO group peptidase (beta-lactamase class C family)
MKLIVSVALGVILVASGGCAHHEDSRTSSGVAPHYALAFEPIRANVQSLIDDGSVPSIVIAVARSGEVVWQEGFGYADLSARSPATVNTPYPIASITKPITATALMVLAENGLVDLDHPINEYLPGGARITAFVGDASDATVARVATHTAGLPLHANHFYDGEAGAPPAMDETIRRYGILVSAPGERYQYSNLGFGLLGYIIERISTAAESYSTSSYAAFMEHEVFVPLGMNDASVYSGGPLPGRSAVKYSRDGIEVQPYVSDCPGSTAIYASVSDLIRFGMFQLKDRVAGQAAILSDAAIDRMQTPSPETGPIRLWEHTGSGRGLGWYIGVTENGTRIVQHTGGTLGVRAEMALAPEEDTAVVVLSNTSSHWPEIILVQILSQVLSLPADGFLQAAGTNSSEPEPTPPSSMAGAWEGVVRCPDRDIPLSLIVQQSGEVRVRLDGEASARLEDVSYQQDLPHFLNHNERRYLRGWMHTAIDSDDVERGSPSKTWIELTERQGDLVGTVVCFSQRTLYTGPLSHWVRLRRIQ